MRCVVLASVLGGLLTSALPAQNFQTTTSSDGVLIRYEAVGDGEPAVVLVHGWSCDRSYWTAQVPALAQDHEVVTVDLAGHGESGADREEWTMANFGEDVAAVVRALDLERVVLVGHSMGGPVAVEAARRLGDRVVGIVGVDSFHDLAFRPSPERTQRSLGPLYEDDFHAAMDTFVRRFFLPTSDPDLVDRVAEDMAGGPEQVVVGAAEGYYRWWREESETAFADLQVPMFLINAESPPTRVETARQYVKEVSVEVVPGVGHFVMLEDAPTFNQVLREAIARLAGGSAGFLSGGTAQPQREQEFDARVGEIMRDWGAPGAVITIVKDGDVVLSRGYGTTRVGGENPVTPSTLASVASVTKTFNATALAMLVDEGLIGWDDPVKKHIPEFEFANTYRTEHTTIRDLITHRAGLPPIHGDAGFAAFSALDYTVEQLLQDLPTAEPRIAFRERVDYSQLGIALLGAVVARVSGTSWPAFVQTRILDALGMDATYPGTDALLHDHPEPGSADNLMGRAVRQDERIVDGPWRVVGRIYVPAGGLVTTGEDMAEFMLFFLANGKHNGRELLSPDRIAEMHTPHEVEGSPYGAVVNPDALVVAYCLGWIAHEHRGRKVVEHPGSNFGSSVVALMPEAGIGVFVSSNATYSLDSDRMVSALKFAALDYALGGLDSE